MFSGPCLPEVDLRLPVGGRLVFVSDLHLGAERPGDFQAGRELVELLESLAGHPGPALLLLGGDVVDLVAADVGTPPAELAAAALARSEAEAVAAALRELAARPSVTVVYLVGNHDAAMAWDEETRGLVGAAFGVHQVAVRARVAVELAGGGELRAVA
jgi:UDP-2,3-diacylglucosamine pyrophosphatase LpxH